MNVQGMCQESAVSAPVLSPAHGRRQLPGMTALTSKQRAHLRRLAHRLKPVVLVGSEGVTPSVIDAVRDAFNTRELLKVKLQESAPTDVRSAADQIADALDDVHPVQMVGRTAVLYRPDPDDPEIRLPERRG